MFRILTLVVCDSLQRDQEWTYCHEGYTTKYIWFITKEFLHNVSKYNAVSLHIHTNCSWTWINKHISRVFQYFSSFALRFHWRDWRFFVHGRQSPNPAKAENQNVSGDVSRPVPSLKQPGWAKQTLSSSADCHTDVKSLILPKFGLRLSSFTES